MKKSEATPRATDRRAFLKGAAVAGGAATIGLATGATSAETADAEPTVADATGPARRGYHVTPHIERYYRLARD